MFFMVKYSTLVRQHMRILTSLQYSSGLFAASGKSVATGYDKAWLRDNFYSCLAFQCIGDWDTVFQTYRAVLNIFLKHEEKIDAVIAHKPSHRHQYIHARFHPETFDEFWEDWGNKQHDSIGALLFGIAHVQHHKDLLVTENDFRIVQKLVWYLDAIAYWEDRDSGIWEENEEVHASSLGACVAGLTAICSYVTVPEHLISRGKKALAHILPRESEKKFVDLALLSLIYPYNIVTRDQAEEILRHVSYHLVREMGVIRYKNDHYYNKNSDGYSEEAEWTFGFSWLSIIYDQLGDAAHADYYMKRAQRTLTVKGEEPELYFSHTKTSNENTPLGWAESLFVVALYRVMKRSLSPKRATLK